MTGVAPDQAAYEAFYAGTECGVPVPWARLTDWDRHWAAAARAAIAASPELAEARAELAALRQAVTAEASRLEAEAHYLFPCSGADVRQDLAGRLRMVARVPESAVSGRQDSGTADETPGASS